MASLPGAKGDGGHVPGQAHLQTPVTPGRHGAADRQGRRHLHTPLGGRAGAYRGGEGGEKECQRRWLDRLASFQVEHIPSRLQN